MFKEGRQNILICYCFIITKLKWPASIEWEGSSESDLPMRNWNGRTLLPLDWKWCHSVCSGTVRSVCSPCSKHKTWRGPLGYPKAVCLWGRLSVCFQPIKRKNLDISFGLLVSVSLFRIFPTVSVFYNLDQPIYFLCGYEHRLMGQRQLSLHLNSASPIYILALVI